MTDKQPSQKSFGVFPSTPLSTWTPDAADAAAANLSQPQAEQLVFDIVCEVHKLQLMMGHNSGKGKKVVEATLQSDTFIDQLRNSPVLARRVLKDYLTVLDFDLPPELCDKIDIMLRYEAKPVPIVDAATLPTYHKKIAVWKGDITVLKIDAIVNAANMYMLGCFTPGHLCIDNVIHSKAGPRLRQECRETLEALNQATEDTGCAKVTRAYNLPSKYVIHTVGPIIKFPPPSAHQVKQLANCYISCLEACKSYGIRSVAFCCISTGVFGYPQGPAAEVALSTVKAWLEVPENDAAMDLVVFDVFTPKDTQIYQELAPQVFGTPSTDAATTTTAQAPENK